MWAAWTLPRMTRATTRASIVERLPVVPTALTSRSSGRVSLAMETSSLLSPRRQQHSSTIALSLQYSYRASALPSEESAVCSSHRLFSQKVESLSRLSTGTFPDTMHTSTSLLVSRDARAGGSEPKPQEGFDGSRSRFLPFAAFDIISSLRSKTSVKGSNMS